MTTHEHPLRPLLAPRSIALVGGSPRQGSVGNLMIRTLLKGGFDGDVTVVNPKYTSVDGLQSVGSLRELSAAPDLAVLSGSSQRMEEMLRQAIDVGARSAVIFDFCLIENDSQPPLVQRLKNMAAEARVPVCGGNGMGFYNFDASTFVSFQEPTSVRPGHIAAICHSGSVFAMLADSAGRYGFNLLTAQGQEISASIADYMEYAIEMPTTRVLALFAETIRDPDRFVAVLEKAKRRSIPIVATKVGRTTASARFAVTHSGALAGDNTAFEAVCRRYNVLRTDDLDGLMAACQILSLGKEIGDGALAALLDSGGLRELMVDLAEDMGLEFASLTPPTVEALRKRLYFGLDAVNPLDAAGLYNEDLGNVMGECLELLASDPHVAIVAHEFFSTDTVKGVPGIAEAAQRMPQRSEKPYVLAYSLGVANNTEFASQMLASGVPVISGIRPLLTGIRCAFDYRNFRKEWDSTPEPLEDVRVDRWRERLRSSRSIGESETLRMLADLGVNAVDSAVFDNADAIVSAAERLGYPVVLKSAAPGLMHKSDVGGVHLGIADEVKLRAAYESLLKLGPEACVARMLPPGVEVAFGMVNDPQFGPVVMVSAGGTMVELLDDRTYALAPFGTTEARRILEGLKIWKMLTGARGKPPTNVDQLARLLSRFSVVCHELRDVILEIDVNPVIANEDSVWAVDAVLVSKPAARNHNID
ncbi:MAG: acetate--CoA ligase family protein [Alphaproteobacteria bacterium]|nr:acetate--CoA ligase family protein [Alphaproteobacteria bacterium]